MEYCNNCGGRVSISEKYCSNCGAKQIRKEQSGAKTQEYVSYNKPVQSTSPYQEQGYQQYRRYDIPKERNYIKYGIGYISSFILLTISMLYFMYVILSGSAFNNSFTNYITLFSVFILIAIIGQIIYLYYTYLNFKDLEGLLLGGHGEQVYPSPYSPILMILVYFVFQPIPVFMKYDQLRKHVIEYHNDKINAPPSPYLVLGILFSPAIIIPIISIPLLFDYFIFTLTLIPIIILVTFGIYFYYEKEWQDCMNNQIRLHFG